MGVNWWLVSPRSGRTLDTDRKWVRVDDGELVVMVTPPGGEYCRTSFEPIEAIALMAWVEQFGGPGMFSESDHQITGHEEWLEWPCDDLDLNFAETLRGAPKDAP